MNSLSYFALQPISELAIWGWRLERRTKFLWRNQFDRFLLLLLPLSPPPKRC